MILYVSKRWVVAGEMLKALTGFHHQAVWQITGMTEKCRTGGEWEYPLVDESKGAAGLHPIGVYIKRRQTTISERMACHPVYALCTEVGRMPGTSRLV